jgi:tetratricopeptide (TPR) repeat protein
MRPAYLVLTGLLAIGAGCLGWVLASPKPSSPEASHTASVEPSSAQSQLAAPRTAWRELLKQRQFDQLEDKLAALQADVEAGKCSECAATGPYCEFSTSDRIIGDRLDEWIKARPESLPAHIARGMYRKHVAMVARGAAYAAATHASRFAEMARLQKGAVEDLDWAVQRSPKASLAYSQLIEIATTQGGEREAAKIYTEAIAHNPESGVIYQSRAWSLAPWWQGVLPSAVALRRLKAYIADLEQRFGGRPGFGWLAGYADYMEAETRARAEDYEGAIAYYTKAIAVGERPSYLVARADAYYRKYGYDRLEEQQADLERALEIAPRNDDALFDMGQLRRARCQQGKDAKATDLSVCQQVLEMFDRAVNEDPLHPTYLTWRAIELSRLGRSEDARRDLEQAWVYGKYDPSLQSTAGDVLRDLDKEAAKSAYLRSVAAAPDVPRYLEHYLQFLIGTGDCDFYEAYKTYASLCQQEKSCTMIASPPYDLVSHFEQMRGRSCAVEAWREPRDSLVLPD